MKLNRLQHDQGYILLVTYIFLAALLSLLAAYSSLTELELSTTRHSKDSATGFFAAEAGLNLRAKEIRDIFVGYNRPSGTSPNEIDACVDANVGTGDFACETLNLNNREVISYVSENPSNPVNLTIPPGEQYQNLNAQEYRYSVRSISRNIEDNAEAILELRFKSRLVPLFQFVAFYDKDLEILPGSTMNLSGPIHTNGDLYLDTDNQLNISGQVTLAGDLYRGRKNNSVCQSHQVAVLDPNSLRSLVPSCGSRTQVFENDVTAWNDMIQVGVDVVTVPEPEALDPSPGQVYWDNADLRLTLKVDNAGTPITNASSPTGIYVMNVDQTENSAATSQLHACSGGISSRPVGSTVTFYNNREGLFIRMAEVDMRALLDCLYSTNWFGDGKLLSDSTEGGLVFHLTVAGPNSSVPNNYGVRIRNAAEIQSTNGAAPDVLGLTVVTDQALYTRGDYNATNKIPAALLCDSINILSNNWNLNDSTSTQSVNSRPATSTTINAALLSGTDSTGGIEGSGGQGGAYNGGLENYPRLHENWSGDTLTYRGSFVSLDTPRHVDGGWIYGNPQYTAPGRNWDYDTDFNDASNLPPLTPRFVYLRQELFVRDFEQ